MTDLVAQCAIKHSSTRWVTLKYVAVRLLEQWINLNEYFLVFFFFFDQNREILKKKLKTRRGTKPFFFSFFLHNYIKLY